MFNDSKNALDSFHKFEEPRIVEAIIQSVIAVIGILGNATNLFVLTRNKINITAIYLNAISIVDILRLSSSIAKVLEYFQWIHLDHDIYWRYRPILTLVNFSAQAASLYIIVSFSINRYIAIRDINRTHFLSTKRANICIIVGIVVLTFLSRIYISMRHVINDSVYYDEFTHKLCKFNNTENETDTLEMLNMINFDNSSKSEDMNENTTINNYLVDFTNKSSINSIPLNLSDYSINHCKKIIFYRAEFKDFRNRPPTWHRMTIVVVFGIIPILLLIIFNIKIILILRESNKRRATLTNAVVLQQKVDSTKHKAPLITKENRTILHLILIKTVISLLRFPYLVYMLFLDYLRHIKNAIKICEYIAEYSLDINSVLNFFLFCILPESNRKQLFETLSKCCCKTQEELKNTQKKKIVTREINGQCNTNIDGIMNLSFDTNELNAQNLSSAIVSGIPGDNRKLQQLSSVTSSSSSYSSQMSQTSEI